MTKNSEDKTAGLDWSQLYWPGPRRVFTTAEMARAGQQPWRRGVDAYVLMCLLLNIVPLQLQLPHGQFDPSLLGLSLLLSALGLFVARHLWKHPSRTRFNLINIGVGLVFLGSLYVLTRGLAIPREVLRVPLIVLSAIFFLSMMGWWAVILLRVQQIESRLVELDERDRSIRLARQLATAQIQPHFLFNTLASVQHWVDTQHPRAAPTLRAFTQYLRSTLPMFDREILSLAEELQIVRHYLAIMQARLGERLAWNVAADASMNGLQLPPGTLLTLVENAIAHGIEPSLRGGRIEVRASSSDGRSILEVRDDGDGPGGQAGEGVGLTNTRARLQHQFGDLARLTLISLNPGCLARIEIQHR
jgi:hypothetical protein